MLEIQGRRVKSREVEFAEESRVCSGRRRAAAWGRRYRFVEQILWRRTIAVRAWRLAGC